MLSSSFLTTGFLDYFSLRFDHKGCETRITVFFCDICQIVHANDTQNLVGLQEMLSPTSSFSRQLGNSKEWPTSYQEITASQSARSLGWK